MPFLFPARVLLTALLAASPAAPAPPNASPSCPAIDAPAPARPRVRAFVDPATGRLREATADELRRLAEERLAARAEAPPRVFVVVEHPDGMKSVDLGDAFLFDVRVETREDGTSGIVCVPPSGLAANPPQ
jgi:hypothetical protein